MSYVVLTIGAAGLACLIGVGSSYARNCDDDTLEGKSDSGEILIMMSGAVYQVLAGDEIDSALWLPPADVLICESVVNVGGKRYLVYEIINTDEHGEKVSATRLR